MGTITGVSADLIDLKGKMHCFMSPRSSCNIKYLLASQSLNAGCSFRFRIAFCLILTDTRLPD